MRKIILTSNKAYEKSSKIKKKLLLNFAGLLSNEESDKIKKEIKEIKKIKSRRF